MKKSKLTARESQIRDRIESGKTISSGESELNRYQDIAFDQVESERKEARINIRMTPSDLAAIKSIAEREGVGYQTLISSILHKYVTGQYSENTRPKWSAREISDTEAEALYEALQRVETRKKKRA